MFDTVGQILIDKNEWEGTSDDLMLEALDLGAQDFNEEDDCYEIITDPTDLSAVREGLEKLGVPMVQAEVAKIPQTYVELTDENDIKNMNRILDLLEEDDDVQDVYHNWDMPEE